MKKIMIQGFTYDEKSSFEKGPALAPPLIREALQCGSMNSYAENGVSIDTPDIADSGDYEISEYLDIESLTSSHFDAANKVFTLGGDHSVSYPILKAFHEKYPVLDVLHIDAHADLYDSFEGDKYSHACPFARIMEDKLANRLVQIGIRTLNSHQQEQAERYGVEIFPMNKMHAFEMPKFNHPVYISIDMDGLDPAFAPGVSHHEPGGLSSRELIGIIQQIDAEVVGADLVEYNPNRDFQKMTAFLAAKIMKEVLVKML